MARMLVDGVEMDMPPEMEATLPDVAPPTVAYIPVYIVRERLEAVGLWEATATALASDPAKLLKVATLHEGIDPGDPEVGALLQAIGADPAAILAPV